MTSKPRIHSLLAEFKDPDQLIQAVRAARNNGYTKLDAYSPLPVHGLAEELGHKRTILPVIVFFGGLTGTLAGYGLQYWVSVIAYPLNIGGRPFHSWPAFIPITFETTVLFAAFSAVIGMLALNKLPMPHHPVFNVRRFRFASRNRFFLEVESTDPLFDLEKTRGFLESLSPSGVYEVEP